MANLVSNISNFATRTATENKALRTLINGNAADLSALTTTSKTSVVSALNELKATITSVSAAAGASVNDAATSSTTQTYSINKIRDLVNTSISAVTAGAPAALDTLDELAAALGDDANFAATITAALGNRLRVDAAQTLNATQKATGLSNLGAVAAADIGDTATDYVSIFNTGLI